MVTAGYTAAVTGRSACSAAASACMRGARGYRGRRSAHWTVRTGLASEGAGAAASSDPTHHPMVVSRSDAAKQLACCMPCTFRLTQECQLAIILHSYLYLHGGNGRIRNGRIRKACAGYNNHLRTPFFTQPNRPTISFVNPTGQVFCLLLFFYLFMKQKTKQIKKIDSWSHRIKACVANQTPNQLTHR